MHLIVPLASGVIGAANGSAAIYQRGTTQFATYYVDFVASQAVTPTAPITLDANGGASVYVNQLVDVVVKDSNGNTVRTFTSGDAAPDIEVISQSFTGTDYTSGQKAASKPTTLQAIEDLWLTNAGALDWKVASGGTTKTLPSWLSGIPNFFNVKDVAYGAKGDNATDDTSAIQSALTAAGNAGGGTVFFPSSTGYKITATLTVPADVSLLGAGAKSTSIILNHATANTINFNGVSTDWVSMRGLGVRTGQANTGKILLASGTYNLHVDDCHIGDATFGSGRVVSEEGTGTVNITNSILEQASSTGTLLTSSSLGMLNVAHCLLRPSAGSGGIAATTWNAGGSMVACDIRLDLITSGTGGTFASMLFGAAGPVIFIGCFFRGPLAGGTYYPFTLTNNASADFFESGNMFGSTFTAPWSNGGVPAAASNHEGQWSMAREARRGFTANDTAAVNIPADQYGTYEVRRTTNGAQTATFATPPCSGINFALVWNNDQAGAGGTITIAGGGAPKGLASFTVNANKVSIYFFRSYENVAAGGAAGSFSWGLVGSELNVAP